MFLFSRATDLGVVGNSVENIGYEPCLVIIPGRKHTQEHAREVKKNNFHKYCVPAVVCVVLGSSKARTCPGGK